MNVSITQELEQFISSKVASGMYQSASEVVREALRLLADQDMLRRSRIEQLNREIQAGLDSAARGEFVTPEETEARLDALLEEMERMHGKA